MSVYKQEDVQKEFNTMMETLLEKNGLGESDLRQFKEIGERLKGLEIKDAEFRKFAGNGKPTISDPFLAAIQENHDAIEKFKRREIKEVEFRIKAVGDMSISNNYSTTPVAAYSAPYPTIVGSSYRAVHMREILRLISIDHGTNLPVIKDNGGEGGFGMTVESAAKSQIDFDLSDATIKYQVLAGYVIFTRQLWNDVPDFQNWLASRLREEYFKAEDSQILTGDGTTANLLGLNSTGNFTAASTTTGAAANRILKSVGQLLADDRAPSFILLHPDDLIDLLLATASGSGEFDLPSVFNVNSAGQLTVMNIPVVSSTAQTADTYNVVDGSGIFIAEREPMHIRLFEDGKDLATTNKILARCESRLALSVANDSYNIKGSFA